MAQLIEPDGTPNIIVSIEDAIDYCRTHPGWCWAEVAVADTADYDDRYDRTEDE